jgi:hypothetical protein
MRRYMFALAGLAALAVGAATTANAVEFGVGPGGVYVNPDRPYYRDDGYDRGYGGNCRLVITHRTNRYGEDVEVRRRVCD